MFSAKETNGDVSTGVELTPKRYSDCSLEGMTEEINSDVMIPETRIPSTPELGTESCSGDFGSEWNIDEQDDWFEGVMCSSWGEPATVGDTTTSEMTLGDEMVSFRMIKKYPQTPILWQMFTKVFINQLTMDFATDSFVKLTWNLMGSNNPSLVAVDPLADKTPVYNDALTTKSFLTKSGFLKIGDSVETLTALRQSPSMSISINNNMERTPALFEQESIENSLGDFVVSGNFDVYNADDTAQNLYNDAVAGKDKILQVQVKRAVGTKTTSYVLTLPIHLGAPTESKNGNKLQFNVPFTMNDATEFKLVKTEVVTA